jgi:uncharacterized protein YegJ (DUF2314 family)
MNALCRPASERPLRAAALALLVGVLTLAVQPTSARGQRAAAAAADPAPEARDGGKGDAAGEAAAEPAEEPRLVSLVFLLREPRKITEAEVRRRLERAFGVPFGDDPDGKHAVMPFPPVPDAEHLSGYAIVVDGRQLGLLVAGKPYVEDPAAESEKIDELRLRKAMREHKAWLSVDWFDDPGAKPGEAYRLLGKALAEFAGGDCLALYAPGLDKLVWYDQSVVEELRSERPLSALEWDGGVIPVEGEDPRMKKAVDEARRRWPEFVKAFAAAGGKGRPFLAKARFEEGDEVEFMWVEVSAADENGFKGTLANEPVDLKQLKAGQAVAVDVAALNDWMYADAKGALRGGFTIKVIEQIQKEAAAARKESAGDDARRGGGKTGDGKSGDRGGDTAND